MTAKRTCTVEGCERTVYGHGWCNMYYTVGQTVQHHDGRVGTVIAITPKYVSVRWESTEIESFLRPGNGPDFLGDDQ